MPCDRVVADSLRLTQSIIRALLARMGGPATGWRNMRPVRFQELATSLAKAAPSAGSVATLQEAGDKRHPFGLAATIEGKAVRIQFLAQSADGDKYSLPEVPVEGDPITPEAVAGLKGTPEERWLAGLLAGSGSREIEGVETWSAHEGRAPGVTVRFHSKAKVFARVL